MNEQEILTKIETLEAQAREVVDNANRQVAYIKGYVAALKDLLEVDHAAAQKNNIQGEQNDNS